MFCSGDARIFTEKQKQNTKQEDIKMEIFNRISKTKRRSGFHKAPYTLGCVSPSPVLYAGSSFREHVFPPSSGEMRLLTRVLCFLLAL